MRRRRHSSAFTIVELLAATALAALLTLASFHVLRAFETRGAGRVGAHDDMAAGSSRQWQAQIRDLVRWDLLQAQGMTQAHNSLVLAGYGSLDPVTRQATHRPVLVQYFIEHVGDRHWLVRRQTSLDVLSDRKVWSDVVCWNVNRFELTPIVTPAELTAEADAAQRSRIFGTSSAPPGPVISACFSNVADFDPIPWCVHLTILGPQKAAIVNATLPLR